MLNDENKSGEKHKGFRDYFTYRIKVSSESSIEQSLVPAWNTLGNTRGKPTRHTYSGLFIRDLKKEIGTWNTTDSAVNDKNNLNLKCLHLKRCQTTYIQQYKVNLQLA